MASKAERDARVDALETAFKAYAKKERARLNAEKAFLEVVKKSSGAGKVASKNKAAAKALLVNNIGQFLSG